MKNRSLLVGLAFGLVGCLFDWCVAALSDAHLVFGVRNAALISATLFFGPLAGGVATLMAMAGRFGLTFLGITGASLLVACPGSLIAYAIACAARRWMFFGERPDAASAALFAAIAAEAHPLMSLLIGFNDLDATIPTLIRTGVCSMASAAVSAAAFAFVLRVRTSLRQTVTSLVTGGLLVAVTAATAILQTGAAIRLAGKTADALRIDAETAVDYPIEPELLHAARTATMAFTDVTAFAASGRVEAIARENDYVLVAAVGADGRVLACSRPSAVGFDLNTDEFAREYLCLNRGESYFTQPFHPQIPAFSDGTAYHCKYVGMPFPGGGFVLIGESFEKIGFRDYLFEAMMQNWHVGENGSMLLVNPSNKLVISGFEVESTGRTMAEVGLEGLRFPEGDLVAGLARGVVLGQDSFVRRFGLEFVPLDVYIVMPVKDVLASRDVSAVLTLIILSLVYAFGAMLLAKIVKQGHDLEILRAKEDESRRRSLELARCIQNSALPSVFDPFPDSKAIDLFARMRAAKEVGGDFFDFFPIGPSRLCCVIADVSGKGVPAAMFMMQAKGVIRAEVQHHRDDLAETMAAVNDTLVLNNTAEMFVTAWIGVLDIETGRLDCVSAGHNPPYLRHADGTVDALRPPRGLVLGAMEHMRYRVLSVRLAAGDSLVLYTDGVTEAQDVMNKLFGESRLAEALGPCGGSAAATCEAVFRAVDAFAAGAPQADDITALVLTWRGR